GLRETPRGLNLNRDYMKADTLEMRAWLRLYNAWLPDFMFDNHVTDGADMQYDVTWDMARNQDIAEPARDWVNQAFIPGLNQRMSEDGHGVAPYGALRPVNGKREFFMEVFSPRYSHLYSAVQNRPCLLVETHSLKSTRTRAWADYDIMKDAITTILKDPQGLRRAVRAADAAMMARAGDRNAAAVYLAGAVDANASRPIVYRSLQRGMHRSEISGSMVPEYLPQPDDVATVIHDRIQTTAEAQMPLGYLIPAGWNQIADELRFQGIEMHRIAAPVTQNFETYRFDNVKFAAQAFEGHVMVDFRAKPVTEKITIPANSYWVPMKQRRARLILALLEPMAPDSLIRWGFMDPVLASGGRGMPNPYLSEPMARRLAADSPELMQQFQAALASDPALAADPQARLRWWFERSPYEPPTRGRYPIVRVWDATGISIDEHVVGVPLPIAAIGEIEGRDAEIVVVEPEAAGAAAAEAPDVARAEAGIESAVLPGAVEMEARIVFGRVVADPTIDAGVHVGSVGRAGLVGERLRRRRGLAAGGGGAGGRDVAVPDGRGLGRGGG